MMVQPITSFLMEYLSIYTSIQFILVKVTPINYFLNFHNQLIT